MEKRKEVRKHKRILEVREGAPMITLQLASLERYPEVPPEACVCPRCGSTRVYGHGRRQRQIRDWVVSQVQVQRFRCAECGATWTVYPQGISPGVRYSLRAEQAMVLLYVLGLSYRRTAAFLRSLGISVSPATVLRAVQGQGEREKWDAQRRIWHGN